MAILLGVVKWFSLTQILLHHGPLGAKDTPWEIFLFFLIYFFNFFKCLDYKSQHILSLLRFVNGDLKKV